MKISKKDLEKLVTEMVLKEMDFGAPRRLTFNDVQAELARLDHRQSEKFLNKHGFEEVPLSGVSNVRLWRRGDSGKLYALKSVSMPKTGKVRLQLEPADDIPGELF